MTLISAKTRETAPLYPPSPDLIPPGSIDHGRYRARFARTAHEREELLRLRFRVFNLELAEGLESSWQDGRDEDRFDSSCHHLLVEDLETRRVVGTYRLQTREMALRGHGFYADGEYVLDDLGSEALDGAVEIGRACIDQDFRNRQVLFLLWKGLARYMMHAEKESFFGCCSLTSQCETEAWKLYDQLRDSGHLHSELHAEARPAVSCRRPSQSELDRADIVQVPTLFRTYLRYGSRVCSSPAIDREFKTIDYLVLFERSKMDARTDQIFFR